MANNLHIITTVVDKECYDNTIGNNSFMNKYKITLFDNKKNNVPVAKRYNSFIENHVANNKLKDTWLVFCHQDFGFLEDPLKILSKYNKNFIYGPAGVKKRSFGNLKFKLFKHFLPYPYIKTKVLALGQIWQGFNLELLKKVKKKNPFTVNNENFYLSGKYLDKPELVDTLDCMCVIVHSSLINKYKLRFDEKCEWHCYVEEFCLNGLINHGIFTKALQFKCKHLSRGNSKNESFEKTFTYLKNKYKNIKFCTPCRNTYDK